MSVDPSQSESQDTSADGESKAAQATSMHLYFPCGIIRGALSNLGIPCAVSADISNLPACKWNKLFNHDSCTFFLLGWEWLVLSNRFICCSYKGLRRSVSKSRFHLWDMKITMKIIFQNLEIVEIWSSFFIVKLKMVSYTLWEEVAICLGG